MPIILNNKPVWSEKNFINTNDTSTGHVPSAFKDIANRYDIYEPQRENHFEFVLNFEQPRLLMWDKAVDESVGPNDSSKYFYDAEEILRVSLDSAFLPEIGVDTIQVQRGNSEVVFAGKPKINHSGTLSFNDWIGTRTYDLLLGWFQMVYNQHTDKVGLAQDYKRTAHIFQYTPTWQLVRAWKLNGVFPTDVKGGALSYSQGGNAQMKVDATLSYDNFEIDYDTLNAKINSYYEQPRA